MWPCVKRCFVFAALSTVHTRALHTAGSHKTSALFGPTRSTLSKRISDKLKALMCLSNADDVAKPYVFHGPSGPTRPHSPSNWCEIIKQCFMRHSGVALAPKGAPQLPPKNTRPPRSPPPVSSASVPPLGRPPSEFYHLSQREHRLPTRALGGSKSHAALDHYPRISGLRQDEAGPAYLVGGRVVRTLRQALLIWTFRRAAPRTQCATSRQ